MRRGRRRNRWEPLAPLRRLRERRSLERYHAVVAEARAALADVPEAARPEVASAIEVLAAPPAADYESYAAAVADAITRMRRALADDPELERRFLRLTLVDSAADSIEYWHAPHTPRVGDGQ
jgi:hypothetical protein